MMKAADYIYYISCLNEETLILAESIRIKEPYSKIFFYDSLRNKKRELVRAVSRLSCKVISESIRSVSIRKKQFRLRFILNQPEENQNVTDALFLAEKYRSRIEAEFYVFASSQESECMLDAINHSEKQLPMKIRRVNPVRNEIYNLLYQDSIFERAVTILDEKVISVLIVGLGEYGTEMLKALLWCGQMQGYVLKVNIIDRSADAEERFYADCPGIQQRGTQPKNGEDYYEINFYSGVDVRSEHFARLAKELTETTEIFVSLGEEQLSIETAMKLRSLFSGMQIDAGVCPVATPDSIQIPRISAVVHNPYKAKMLNQNQLCNFKRQYYNIHAIGNDDSVYSCENIFASELEKLALASHLQWGTEESFDRFEYYRRSSMASAIHKKYREQLLPPDEDLRAMNEHIRWNAYMRSTEGYAFGYIRNDLAKRHSSLVKYSLLCAPEQKKDFNMNKTVKEVK